MNPRLKTSKKWTAFPAEFIAEIKNALTDNFGTHLNKKELVIEGRIYAAEILLRLGFREEKELRQNNFEVSIDYTQDKAMERIHDAIDVAASMMGDYFENESDDSEYPRDWKEFDFESLKVWCQFSTVNTKLESEADRLLGSEEDPALVNPVDDDEDSTEPRDKSKLH